MFDSVQNRMNVTGSEVGARAAVILLAARVLLSFEFIFFGVMKLLNSDNMQAYMESRGVPGILIWPVILLQIGAGLCVLFGYRTRPAALTLAGFCVVATTLFHFDFSDLGEVSDFTKDLATAGGFLCLFVAGPGRLSLDTWLATRTGANRHG